MELIENIVLTVVLGGIFACGLVLALAQAGV